MPRQSNMSWHCVFPRSFCMYDFLLIVLIICLIQSEYFWNFHSKCLPLSLTSFFKSNHSQGNGSILLCSRCGWCEQCKPATLLQCPRLSLSGLPPPQPRLPPAGVLSKGQLLWTQATVPFVLPGLGMHSAIFSRVSASPTGCQTCGPYSYASSSLSLALFHSVCLSLWQCQCLSHRWRALRGTICVP